MTVGNMYQDRLLLCQDSLQNFLIMELIFIAKRIACLSIGTSVRVTRRFSLLLFLARMNSN